MPIYPSNQWKLANKSLRTRSVTVTQGVGNEAVVNVKWFTPITRKVETQYRFLPDGTIVVQHTASSLALEQARAALSEGGEGVQALSLSKSFADTEQALADYPTLIYDCLLYTSLSVSGTACGAGYFSSCPPAGWIPGRLFIGCSEENCHRRG